VPHFRAFLEYNLYLNNLNHLVDVRSNVRLPSKSFKLVNLSPTARLPSKCLNYFLYFTRSCCRVRAVDGNAVIIKRAYMTYLLLLQVVTHVAGQITKMVVPTTGIWGTASIDGLNADRNEKGGANFCLD
jgi:hypothetical protein